MGLYNFHTGMTFATFNLSGTIPVHRQIEQMEKEIMQNQRLSWT